MLEAKYFKDYRHNYMILQCGQEAAVRSYQYKILTSDKIREILRCSVRHINGVTYYYYDISSRTTLRNLYQSSKMSYEQVKDLFCQIHGICDKLAGFFMEEAGLVLLPEHIYYDFSAQKYIGLYYPDYQATGGEAYEPLMHFLLEHIDGEDRQLAEKMYRICEMAGEPHFLIEDAIRILEEREEAGGEFLSGRTEAGTEERGERRAESGTGRRTESGVERKTEERAAGRAENGPEGVWRMPVREEDGTGGILGNRVEAGRELSGVAEEGKPDGSAHSLFYIVFAVLSLLGIAGAGIVFIMYELVEEEEIALCGIMAVLGVCFLASLWGAFRGSRKKQTVKNGAKEAEERVFEEAFAGMADGTFGAFCGAAGAAPDNSINRERNLDRVYEPMLRDASGEYDAAPGKAGYFRDMPSGMGRVQDQEMDYCGNTIFFDGSKVAEYKLYAVDRRNKCHIELKQFPCTIGKMAGCVDHVLADQSVSRIHARFDKQGDKVFLTDMNSTNGTYKNGLRMQPQETVEIEPGDEIRFGGLNYCYR